MQTSSPDSKESGGGGATPATTSSTAKPKPDSPTKGEDEERRPSWRLKVDDTDKNRVMSFSVCVCLSVSYIFFCIFVNTGTCIYWLLLSFITQVFMVMFDGISVLVGKCADQR